MKCKFIATVMVAALCASAAAADLIPIKNEQDFVRIIEGKTLTRPLIKLTVSSDGRIEGRGARWDVEGSWTWRDGYFCRDLVWGGDNLGYNCQEVRADDRGRIKFTSDQGTGDSAVFRLR